MLISTTQHVPVLIQPIVSLAKDLKPCWILDGTLGGGGHTLALADLVPPNGGIVSCDRDPMAVENFNAYLREIQNPPKGNIHSLHCSYHEISPQLLQESSVPATGFDLILLDLGFSSDQLADQQRGFSFMSEGELDLRFDRTQGEPTWEILHSLDEKSIADLIFQLGEERFSRRIAMQICRQRKVSPIKTARQLRELIANTVPGSRHGRIDPATRTFQALRIYANEELRILADALQTLPKLLNVDGQFHIISFHSLEDRLVKNAFRDSLDLEPLTRKPIIADDEELEKNPRSRSAKLRVAGKLASSNLKQPVAHESDFRRHR